MVKEEAERKRKEEEEKIRKEVQRYTKVMDIHFIFFRKRHPVVF